jgi:PAS domain S-box-containing protein
MSEPALKRPSLVGPAFWVTAAVFLTALGGIALTQHTGRVASIWLANAMVLLVMLRRPGRTWPLWLGCGLAGNLAADLVRGDASGTALALTGCNLVEILLAGWLIRRLNREDPVDLSQTRTFIVSMGAGGVLAPAVSAALAGWILHEHGGSSFWPLFRTWFLGDALGILILVPLFHGVTWRQIAQAVRLRNPAVPISVAAGLAAGLLVGTGNLQWLFLLSPLFLLSVFSSGFLGAGTTLGLATLAGLTALAFRGGPAGSHAQLRSAIEFLQVFIFTNILACLPCANLLRKVRENEARMREIAVAIEQSPVTVVITDAAGAIEYVNPRFTEITGYTPGEALGQNPRILKSGEQPAELYRDLWDTLAKGLTWRGEFHNRRKDGGLFWEAATIAPVKDPAGRTTHFVAIKEDITSFKAARESAAESQALLSAIVDSTHDFIWSVEPAQFRLWTFNAALRDYIRNQRHLDLEPGLTPAEFFPPGPYADFWLQNYHRVLEEGSLQVDVYQVSAGNRSLSVNMNLVRRDGEPYLISVFARDVTALQQKEKEIRKLNEDLELRVEERTRALAGANRELEAFSYSVSHDLRAPLRAVDGFSQALVEDYGPSLDPGALHLLGRVRHGAQKMGQLIDDLLKLSRVSQGELDRRPIDLSGLAGRILSDLAQKDGARTVRATVAPGLSTDGDPRLVAIALQNLLGNAWKYTGRKASAEIEVGVRDLGGKPVFFVRDNGSGFDMAYQDKLFLPFQRLHAAQDFEGSGIGLAIVERIIRRHGGRIWAEAEPDRGATFWFTFQD